MPDSDVSFECFGWYVMEKNASALIDDSTDSDADGNQATNTTLKSSDHTLYSTTLNDPDWDNVNGWARIGTDLWLCQPLKQNLIRPSLQYLVSFIYKLGAEIDGNDSYRINVFAGIWDDTTNKFIEGSAITLNAEVEGLPTATTSTTYFVIFYTNWGESIGTAEVTVAAPTTYSDTQYVYLSWDQPVGVIRTEIYRKRGSLVKNLNPPYPAGSYKDKGATRGADLSAFPTADRTKAKAYMRTTQHNLPLATTKRWIKSVQLNIPIPKDYNASLTTGRQWFVMGLTDPVKDASNAIVPHAIFIDRVSLSDKPGEFARSAWDADAKRSVTALAHSGDVGGLGGGSDGSGDVDPGGTNFREFNIA